MSLPHFTIEPMTADHLTEVERIEKAVFRDPWSGAAFREALKLCETNWVAVADGQVAGYLVTQWVLDEIHILNIAVAPDLQRQEVGRRLMEFLLDRARERGMHDLFLEVRVSNVAALALYRRFGFSVLTVRSRYYSDGEDANLLHCVLPEMDDAAEETPEAAGGLRTER